MHKVIQIIRKMTSREKAYFRKFSKMHHMQAEKNYLKLYEAISKHKHMEVEELRKQFKGTKLYTHFSSEMNYLFEQLMKSLLNYNLNSNENAKVLKNIAYIEILLAKGNKKMAAKLLRNAKLLAYKKEDFPLIIKLIELEEQILFKQGILNFIPKLEALRKERSEVNLKIENINELRVLKERIRDFQYTHIFIDEPASFPAIFQNPLVLDKSKALSLTALDYWHYAYVAMEYVRRSYQKGIEASFQYFLFLENNAHLFGKEKRLPAISNYLLFLSLMKDTEGFYQVMDTLELLAKTPGLDQAYVSYIKIGRTLELSYRTFDGVLAKQTLADAEAFLTNKYAELAASHKEFFFFRIVRTSIDIRDFEKAQELINSWYQHGVLEFMISVRRMLKLIILYELNWHRVLETEVLASYKILRRHQKYHKLEKVLLSFFRKITKGQFEERKQLERLENQLKLIEASKADNKFFEYFNYRRWCQDKLTSLH